MHLVSLLAGCFFITDAEHAARLAAADADADADTDTDTDADADADSDTDTDTDTDTDVPPTGTLTGEISMTVEGTLTGTDSCVGDVLVDLDADDLLGTFDCRFGGGLYDDQAGNFEGDGGGGTLTFESSFDTSGPWDGNLGGGAPVTLTGSFRFEDVPWSLGSLTVSGYFSASAAE